jgi:hypothetical protein
MYRYIVDKAVTYTPEDFVLFRESPFACWMERLTLENPEHGIPTDTGSLPPGDSIERQDDMADTLRGEGKDVRLIDWDADEPGRRTATLDAMRSGVDFIVNAQLALGPLSGAANLLVRTSGYSELGDFLYIPCETQSRSAPHPAFRLCFLADLLHSLQGQLPPQMLIIRGGDDLVPLQTETHIYHYRAIKQRFMESMRSFRKHRMPDPAESFHFGRWSDCAHEVLKQRLLREDHQAGGTEPYEEPLRKAAGATGGGSASAYDPDDVTRPEAVRTEPTGIEARDSAGAPASFTLAEQARMLKPGTYTPGPGVYRIGRPRPAPAPPWEGAGPAATHPPVTVVDTPLAPMAASPQTVVEPIARPQYNRRSSDAALQNLEFIRSAAQGQDAGVDAAPAAIQQPPVGLAPAPSLRDPRGRKPDPESFIAAAAPDSKLGKPASWDPPPGPVDAMLRLAPGSLFPPPETTRPEHNARSAVDMDGTHFSSPPPGLTTSDMEPGTEFGFGVNDIRHGFGQAATEQRPFSRPIPFSDDVFGDGTLAEDEPGRGRFSDSLMTSDDYDS